MEKFKHVGPLQKERDERIKAEHVTSARVAVKNLYCWGNKIGVNESGRLLYQIGKIDDLVEYLVEYLENTDTPKPEELESLIKLAKGGSNDLRMDFRTGGEEVRNALDEVQGFLNYANFLLFCAKDSIKT